MKYQTAAAVIMATAVAGFAVAKAPDIDQARIDSEVARILKQAEQRPESKQQPDGKAIRQEVVKHLQSIEILKNAALKAGLDKDPEVRNQFLTMEAEFYAAQYADYLKRTAEISNAELLKFYDQQTRMIKIQQVSFDTPEEARAAQELLLKGLSFEELTKRYPNQQPAFEDFVMARQLRQPLAGILGPMNRGEVTHNPVEIENKFFLFKISEVQKDPQAPPFDLIRDQLTQLLKEDKAQQQIHQLLRENGIEQ